MSRDILWKSWENELLPNLPDLTENWQEVCNKSGHIWKTLTSQCLTGGSVCWEVVFGEPGPDELDGMLALQPSSRGWG